MNELQGKRVLITAAGQGIGLASARAFAAAGAEVIATDIAIGTPQDEPGLTALPLDVTSAQAIAALSEQAGTVDVLFNCADYIAQGIRCNAICPGTVDSPSLRVRIAEQAALQGVTEEPVYGQFLARQPMGRIGSAEEIARLVLYLGSDASSYTTGALHVIDGGMGI